MKKLFCLLLVIWTMTATQSTATAQEKAAILVEFTSEIGDGVYYSVFELAEYIFTGQTPSDVVADSILNEYGSEFPENCGENSPAITVLQYDEGEFLCLQHNADGEIISVCMKTVENGWVENDPQQENILWKLSLLTMFSQNLFDN